MYISNSLFCTYISTSTDSMTTGILLPVKFQCNKRLFIYADFRQFIYLLVKNSSNFNNFNNLISICRLFFSFEWYQSFNIFFNLFFQFILDIVWWFEYMNMAGCWMCSCKTVTDTLFLLICDHRYELNAFSERRLGIDIFFYYTITIIHHLIHVFK